MSAFTQEDQDIVSRFAELQLRHGDGGGGAAGFEAVADDAAAALEAAAAAASGNAVGEAAHVYLRSLLPAPAFAPPAPEAGADATPQRRPQQLPPQQVQYDIPSVPRFGFGSDIASSGEASIGSFLGGVLAGEEGQQHQQQQQQQQQAQEQGPRSHRAKAQPAVARQQQHQPPQAPQQQRGARGKQQQHHHHHQQSQRRPQQQQGDQASALPVAGGQPQVVSPQERHDSRDHDQGDGISALLDLAAAAAAAAAADGFSAPPPPPMERAESPEARSSEDGRGPAAAAASFLSSFAQDNVQQQQEPQQQRQQRRSSNDDLRLPLGRDGLRDASRVDPSKVEAAAEALADVVAGASAEAIGLRAAAMFGHTTELRTGAMQWTRGELLGEGAYGKVYAGLNQMTGELMAVKALELVGRSGSAEAAAQLADLVKELDLYKKLKHKHVVGYIDATFEARQNTLFIFLEYVPGGSIASMVSRFGRFGEELARIYTRQLLLGLEYLHSCKIVHRDVKGGNVLVTRDGIVKLADFGASKAYRDATKTDAMKSMRGSVFWMAPEVIKGTGYGRRADIWSLGCTVIEMLTGSHPWPERDNHWSAMFAIAHSTEGPPRPPGISATAEDFLDHCLQVDPSKRPTATELLQHPWVATADTARGETEGGGFGGGGGGGPSGDGRALNHSF